MKKKWIHQKDNDLDIPNWLMLSGLLFMLTYACWVMGFLVSQVPKILNVARNVIDRAAV